MSYIFHLGQFHTFFQCQPAKVLWLATTDVWRLPHLSRLENLGTEWLMNITCDLPETDRVMLLITLWRIAMRSPTTNLPRRSKLRDAFSAKTSGRLWAWLNTRPWMASRARAWSPTVRHLHHLKPWWVPQLHCPKLAWVAPSTGTVKLNVDGSSDVVAGLGMVLCDQYDELIFSFCRQLFKCHDALKAKLSFQRWWRALLITFDLVLDVDKIILWPFFLETLGLSNPRGWPWHGACCRSVRHSFCSSSFESFFSCGTKERPRGDLEGSQPFSCFPREREYS